MASTVTTDVVILGAGPSGAAAAALLHQRGQKVLVLERQTEAGAVVVVTDLAGRSLADAASAPPSK